MLEKKIYFRFACYSAFVWILFYSGCKWERNVSVLILYFKKILIVAECSPWNCGSSPRDSGSSPWNIVGSPWINDALLSSDHELFLEHGGSPWGNGGSHGAMEVLLGTVETLALQLHSLTMDH